MRYAQFVPDHAAQNIQAAQSPDDLRTRNGAAEKRVTAESRPKGSPLNYRKQTVRLAGFEPATYGLPSVSCAIILGISTNL